MLSKNQIKFVSSLQQKKFRIEYNLFIAEGNKIVKELLNSSLVVKQLYATSEFLVNERIESSIETFEINEKELARISALTNVNQVLAVCEIPNYIFDIEALQNKLTLVLDEIKDPGNLGTIIRIADWFGIENIICSTHTADIYNPKVVQSSMGSISRIKCHYLDLMTFFKETKLKPQQPIYGALLKGENIYTKSLTKNGFIVIGNESKGISESITEYVTDKISIPSFSYYKSNEGEAESLNAAIATSIICSEFRRRE